MIAEMTPQIGGAPEATAMPRENGSEMSETTNPAAKSCLQCFNPAKPLRGFSVLFGTCDWTVESGS
jgi:hypothetical protein